MPLNSHGFVASHIKLSAAFRSQRFNLCQHLEGIANKYPNYVVLPITMNETEEDAFTVSTLKEKERKR